MAARTRVAGLPPRLWTLVLVITIAAAVVLTVSAFNGTFVSSVPVTLTSDRAGLVMEGGGKVKMRGVQVGRVKVVKGESGGATLKLELYPTAVRYIPANVVAEIRATTAFGAKYVDLRPPEEPAKQRIQAGAVLHSRNVASEVNTVFENLTQVLGQVEPSKLNAVLTALAEGLRGKGERIGAAMSDASEVIAELNTRMPTIRHDWQSVEAFSDTYAEAAQGILQTLSSATAVSATVVDQAQDLNSVLLGTIGLSRSGSDLLGPNKDTFINLFNRLRPTAELLHKYNPIVTCTLQGALWGLTEGRAYDAAGGNGRTQIADVTIGLSVDPYRYPDNLPIIAAKGGPDGRPGCNGMPRVDQHMPVRYLVTNTGFGTGLDMRPNPGFGHPLLKNYFPTTKDSPEPPRAWRNGPPAIGPVPYPGAPPYGAPLYAPDGTPLWAPPPPGAPPPPVPGIPNPPPPYGTGTGPTGQR